MSDIHHGAKFSSSLLKMKVPTKSVHKYRKPKKKTSKRYSLTYFLPLTTLKISPSQLDPVVASQDVSSTPSTLVTFSYLTFPPNEPDLSPSLAHPTHNLSTLLRRRCLPDGLGRRLLPAGRFPRPPGTVDAPEEVLLLVEVGPGVEALVEAGRDAECGG